MSPVEWVALAALLVAKVAIGLGAYAFGLYRGEKGRRQAAETYLVFGVPENPGARNVTPGNGHRPAGPARPIPPAPTSPKGFDQATIAKGAQILQDEARASGLPVPSDDEASTMAEQMLVASMGEADDIAL